MKNLMFLVIFITACATTKTDPMEYHIDGYPKCSTISYNIDPRMPEEFRKSVQLAMDDWNKALGYEVFEIKAKNADHSILWMTDWAFLNSHQEARTDLRWRQWRIIESDIYIDAKYWRFYQDGDGRGRIHMESLLVHELGHALGLMHNQEEGSVMDHGLRANTIRNKILQVDAKHVSCR